MSQSAGHLKRDCIIWIAMLLKPYYDRTCACFQSATAQIVCWLVEHLSTHQLRQQSLLPARLTLQNVCRRQS